jgi:hypothetical protein
MKKIFTIIMLSIGALSNAQVNNLQLVQLLHKSGYIDLKPDDVTINNTYTEKKSGVTHIYFKQLIDNAEVFNTQSSIHIDKN